MVEEIFGPVLTVRGAVYLLMHTTSLTTLMKVHVYDGNDFDGVLELVDTASQYALTGAM